MPLTVKIGEAEARLGEFLAKAAVVEGDGWADQVAAQRALDDDYRLSALWHIMTPAWQAGANIPTVIWWNNFERIHLAVEDLGSRELLE